MLADLRLLVPEVLLILDHSYCQLFEKGVSPFDSPTSSPIAKDPLPAPMAEKVLNTSGDPFPKAKKVTPVYQVERGRYWRC